MADTYDLNPNIFLHLEPNEQNVTAVTVVAPVKGEGCRVTTVEAEREPQVFALLRSLIHHMKAEREIDLPLSGKIFGRLKAAGVLLPLRKISKRPQFRSPLIRRDSKKLEVSSSNHLIVNPTLRVVPQHEIAFASSVLTRKCAWIEMETPGTLAPGLYATRKRSVRFLRPGAAHPNPSASLIAAGLFVDKEMWKSHAKWKQTMLAGMRRAYAQDRYVNVGNLFPRSQIRAMQSYFRNLIDGGFLPLGDIQVSRRYVEHNEPVARLFHLRLREIFSFLVGEPTKPSYVYLGAYLSGAELKPHRDRIQCEHSATFLVDFDPRLKNKSPWPIFVKSPVGKSVATYQAIGDALFYHGHEMTHWRPVLEHGARSVSLFLHYVPETFQGSLD